MSNRARPPNPQKRTAAPGVGARDGGKAEEATKQLHRAQCPAALRGSTLNLAPIWSDEGYLCGWISLDEARRSRGEEDAFDNYAMAASYDESFEDILGDGRAAR